ncbi:IS256 family transposase [Candidatus Poriferisocius sp.]|uniref:IS256 family transposase n=1 Tax=Candidatus Poriferisocius sp. TaxID=3101276 RepID=UPI003B5191DD
MTDQDMPAVSADEAAGEAAMQDWAELLVERARADGVDLTGDGGLLTGLVRQVLQTGLEVEMADHLGYERHAPEGRGSGNSRNGSSPKRVTTEIGEIDLRVPRDRAGTFEPVTVPKHRRRLDGLSGNVISLYAKGLTTGEIQAHLAEIYDTSVSRETISKITDEIVSDMAVWQNRPLDAVYAVLLIDAIVVKVRDSQVANRPVYVAIGVDLQGERDVLGLWLGPSGGEGAKQWAAMLGELRNRGLADALIVCCDGLKGLPDSIRATWPDAVVQTCVVHMVRNSLRYASKTHRGPITRSMREIYTAPTVGAAEALFEAFAEDWEDTYPAMIRAWRNSWTEFTPFLEFPAELRRVVYTTNAVESLNARFRRAVRHRGHFPNEQAAMKILYLVATAKRKNRSNLTGKTNGWKAILNTLTVHYGDRIADHIK